MEMCFMFHYIEIKSLHVLHMQTQCAQVNYKYMISAMGQTKVHLADAVSRGLWSIWTTRFVPNLEPRKKSKGDVFFY